MAGTKDHDARMPSPAAARALDVLEALVISSEELTLTALAKKTGIPLATCASIAYTLEARGYAGRRVVGRSHFWYPTLRMYSLSAQLMRKVDLSSIAQQEMRELSDSLGMPVHLGVLTGASVIYVAKAATPDFIQFDTYLGKVSPFDLTALGRAIAAHLPDAELEPLLDQLTPGRGPKARPSDPATFTAELAKVRKNGYAFEDQEEQAQIACVAAPFFGVDGRVAGAVGVTGFAKDLQGQKRTAAHKAVTELGKVVSRKLGATDLSRTG